MIRHIFITNKNGEPIYSKCYYHNCELSNIDNLRKSELAQVLKMIKSRNPFTKIMSINFEDMRLLVEVRENVIVFFEVDKNDKDERYKEALKWIAKSLNEQLSHVTGEEDVNKRIKFVLEKKDKHFKKP